MEAAQPVSIGSRISRRMNLFRALGGDPKLQHLNSVSAYCNSCGGRVAEPESHAISEVWTPHRRQPLLDQNMQPYWRESVVQI